LQLNGLSIAKSLSLGERVAGECGPGLNSNALWDSRGPHYGRETAMKPSTNPMAPIIEAKAGKAATLSERPLDRDPGEFLPWLPCTLALDLPIINFTVGDLLSLSRGSIVETSYHQSSDLPLRVNGQLVGWTEFEVVGDRLAVRLTDLS
jgi:flagellar motor switch/type III secretory pathway protein FliN